MLVLCAAFWAQRKGIVASDYGGILGVPTLFERCYFSRLLNLADGEGPKRLISMRVRMRAVYRSAAAHLTWTRRRTTQSCRRWTVTTDRPS